MSLINDIQNNLSLDKIKYLANFKYEQSPYANMDFPEIGDIDLFNIVKEPNKNSSTETLQELNYIAKLTNNRSQKDVNLIYTVDDDPLYIFEPVLDQLNINFDYDLFDRIYFKCVIAMIDHLKFFYNRARPIQISDALNIDIDRIVTKTHGTPSYPSGHTMYAALVAEILIDQHPEHKTKFESLTEQTALARVLQGVHYPSDNRASVQIIKTIFPKLKQYFMEQ